MSDPLLKHLNQEPPSVLYHYTSLSVLEKVTDTGELWASEARFLNDSTEYEHAREYIRGMLKERTRENRELSKRVKDDLRVVEQHSGERDVFITSFSRDGDSLPQWRGYCSAGHGVAIGFNPIALTNGDVEFDKGFRAVPDDEPEFEWSLLKCVYSDHDKEKLIGDSIDGYLQVAGGSGRPITPNRGWIVLLSTIQMCSPLFKDVSFKEEKEWRLVVDCYYPIAPKRHFRLWGSTAVPFIKINLRKNHTNDFIKDIVIGPCPNEDLALLGVKRLLAARGLSGASVRKSTIPYRTW